MSDLARALVAHPRWRWGPGMRGFRDCCGDAPISFWIAPEDARHLTWLAREDTYCCGAIRLYGLIEGDGVARSCPGPAPAQEAKEVQP